jgi:hypothetical protein
MKRLREEADAETLERFTTDTPSQPAHTRRLSSLAGKGILLSK